MWATAVLGAVQLGMGIYGAVKSAKDKPESLSISNPSGYSQTQNMLASEVMRQQEIEAATQNQISKMRAGQISMANELYRDPQSRFLNSLGINNTTIDTSIKANAEMAGQRRALLGTQLTIDQGRTDIWRSYEAMRMEKYKTEVDQYNREQEAWGAAMAAGTENLANAEMYSSVSGSGSKKSASVNALTDSFANKKGVSNTDNAAFWNLIKKGDLEGASWINQKY